MEPHRYLPDNEWPHQLLLVSRSYRFGDSFNGSIHCHARIEAKEIYERGREVEEVVAMQRFVYAPRPATRVCTHGVEGAAARGISGG